MLVFTRNIEIGTWKILTFFSNFTEEKRSLLIFKLITCFYSFVFKLIYVLLKPCSLYMYTDCIIMLGILTKYKKIMY